MLNVKAAIRDNRLCLALPEEVFIGCIEGFRNLGAKVWIPNSNVIEVSGIVIDIIIDKSDLLGDE